MRIPTFPALLLTGALATLALLGAAPPASGDDGAAADTGSAAYEKFVTGAERRDGLFPVIIKDGKVYIEIAKSQFDRDFLEHATTANGLGGFGLLSGDDFEQEARIVHFVRVNDKAVAVIWPHVRFQAPPNTALATAIKASTADSVQAVMPIVAEDKATGKVVIDTSFLLGDNLGLGNALSDTVRNTENPEGGYRLDPSRTYYGPAKAFPKNDLIEVDQTFASGKPDTIDTVSDPRTIQLRIKYNFAEILSSPDYMPRLVDDRVGFWNETRVAFDNMSTLDTNVRYITRWNLRAGDPTKPSPATRPLVYTLTNTIPPQYKPAIRDALLEWNKAFERIGILNAIQVQDQPDDPNWDPDDIRYNTVRWLTEANGGGFAEAQIEWDPRTGEIFRSGILIDSDIMRFLRPVYGDSIPAARFPARAVVGDPADPPALNAALDPALWDPSKYSEPSTREAVHSGVALHRDSGMERQAEFGAMMLRAWGDGSLPPNFDYDFLKGIILHESGHDFGLAHNFIGHNSLTMAQLQSQGFTTANGVASSVMEYAPINLWPRGSKQGAYWQTTLGSYDYHVIHWGYAPIPGATTPEAEVSTLNRWAGSAVDPKYTFASDEDAAWNGHAVDPRVAQFLLSSTPVQWCESQLGLYKNALTSLDSRLPRSQQTWDQSRSGFQIIMSQTSRCAGSMAHYVAGEYLHRGRPGDSGVRTALTPVARSEQEHAFRNIDKYLFSDTAFVVAAQTLNRTVYSEYEPIDNFGYNPTLRHDISLSALAGLYQARTLAYMFSPLVLQRLADMSLKSRPGETMSTADLFAWTQASIFGDLQSGKMPKTMIRRNLQRMYARLLEKVAISPASGTPPDAQALALSELVSLSGDLRKDLGNAKLDMQTRAHLQALQAEVSRTLDVRGVLPMN